jgi:Uma2 family endonuclease
MATLAQSRLLTAEEFMAMPDDEKGRKYELVRGKVLYVSEPAAQYHGERLVQIAYLLKAFLHAHPIARISAEAGVTLARNPDTVRVPDVLVTRNERYPRDYVDGPIFEVAPDLVIEIRSPSERPGILRGKLHDYFAAGTTVVWVVDQRKRLVTVHTADASPHVIQGTEHLTGDPVLPGFSCTLDELFR